MANEWYKSKRRRALLDMHIEDWDPSFLSKFDPKVYFDALVEAHVNAVMVPLQSHVGLCYWPSKSGKMHGAFKGREDTMNRLFDLCHKAGMDITAYYSVVFDNWAYDNYPEWRLLDANGNGSRFLGSRYGLCCPNNVEYREFTAKQIKEMCALFTFEHVFIDMTFWPYVCHCQSCRDRWFKETGENFPLVIDWWDPKWLKFQEARGRWLSEYAQFLTALVKNSKPGCTMEHQYAGTYRFWARTVNENLSLASDFIGTDLYGGLEEQSFACKTWYNLTRNQPFQYMTSRCYPNLAEHTTTKTLDQLRTCVMLTMLHHGAPLMIDAVDPVGTIDPSVYKKIGRVYREAEKFEPWLSRGKLLYDAALYFNFEGKMNVERNGIPLTSPEAADPSMPHLDALKKVAYLLRKRHIPYSVVTNSRPDLLENIKVLILPDAPNISADNMEKIKHYVEGGGKLYMSAHSAPSLLNEFFGVEWQGLTDEDVTYISPTGNYEPLASKCTKEHPLVMFEKAVKAAGNGKGEIWGTITLPYTLPNPHDTMSFHDASIKITHSHRRNPFAAIHSNPPSQNTTDLPALMYVKYGKGEVIWSALPIEKADRPQHNDLFVEIIKGLAQQEKLYFEANAAESIECILFEDAEVKQKIMGIINLQENFYIMPAVDTTIHITSGEAPKAVYSVPDKEPIPYRYADGRITLSFDRIVYYQVFVIQY